MIGEMAPDTSELVNKATESTRRIWAYKQYTMSKTLLGSAITQMKTKESPLELNRPKENFKYNKGRFSRSNRAEEENTIKVLTSIRIH